MIPDRSSAEMDVTQNSVLSPPTVNCCLFVADSNGSEDGGPLISGTVRTVFVMMNNVILGSIIGLFGIAANIINIIIFSSHFRKGCRQTINVSLTALAVGDIGALLALQWFNICVNPWFRESGISFEPIEIQTLTGGFPHFYFTRVTGWITAFINIERCLGILKPLRVRMIITSKLAMAFNIGIFLVMLLTVIPIYCTTYFAWKFYPERNETLLGVRYTDNVAEVQGVTFTVTNVVMATAFIIVIVCTIIITVKLHNRSKWWNTAGAQSTGQRTQEPDLASSKETRLVKIIVSISIIYLVCSLPMVCFTMARALEPEINIIGKYANLNWFIASWVFLLQTINSSINIFIYHNMSSAYRASFRQLFSRCQWKRNVRFETSDSNSASRELRGSVFLLKTSILQLTQTQQQHHHHQQQPELQSSGEAQV